VRKKKKRPQPLKKIIITIVSTLIIYGIAWFQEELVPQASLPTRSTALYEKPLELYANQVKDDLTQLFLSSINNAQHSIHLIIYALTDPQIISALQHQAEKGIDVRVIADAKASPNLDSKLGSKIRIVRRFGPGLMHQKILVIDEKRLLIGSANLTRESLSMHGNLVTAIDCEPVAKMMIAKANTLKIEGRCEKIPYEEFFIGNQKMEFWFLPDNKNGMSRLQELISTAKKTVQVAMFTWTSTELAQSTIEAAKRGVKVEVVIDHYSGKGASSKIVKLFKKNGIDVSLSQGGPLLHHKFLLIDDHTLVNGSANWTRAAFTQNDDCFFILSPLNDSQKNQMKKLWSIIKAESI
jgi:cardiolipin synthase A/B